MERQYRWEENGNDAEPPLSIYDKDDGVIAYCMDDRVAERICRLLEEENQRDQAPA